MLAERDAQVAASKKNAKSKPVPTADEVAATNDSMDVSMENPAAVAKSKSLGDEEMEDVADDQEESPAPMAVEAPASLKKQWKTKTDAPSPWKSRGTTGTENHQPSIKYSPNKQAPTNAGNGTEKPEGQNETARPASPHRSASPFRSQSPLRRMQSTVQSALRNLRPVSPKKHTEEPRNSPKNSIQKPTKQIVALPQAFSTDSTESTTSSQSSAVIPATAASSAPLVPIPGTIRPFMTPAVPSSGTSKLGGMSINADSVKAKNNARMARIAEMRNKSKPVSASSTSAIPTIGGLKVSSSLKTAASSSKRHNLTSQMREKAFGRLGQAATTLPAAPPQTIPSQQPITQATASSVSSTNHPSPVASPKKSATPPPKQARSPVLSPLATASSVSSTNHPSPVASPKKSATPPPKQARSPVLSPLDTYEMSDHGGSSDTDEEEERSRRVGKRVPNWAHKENLKKALHHQYTDNSVDPDDLFGEVTTCNLEAIFGRKKTKYQKRTSSGNWTKDRATVAEKLAFKRQMGYAAVEA
eukprot:scaffold2062_cov166-Amphora_coffeaeformis.AAC.4